MIFRLTQTNIDANKKAQNPPSHPSRQTQKNKNNRRNDDHHTQQTAQKTRFVVAQHWSILGCIFARR